MKTVSLLWVRGLLQAVALQGLDEDSILTNAGLDKTCLSADNGRISLEDTLALWRAIEQLSGDPLFGLKIGLSLKPGHFQLFASTMLSSSTLGDAIDKILKYQRLISDGGAFSMLSQGDTTTLIYTPSSSHFSYHQIDAVMVAIVGLVRWVLTRDIVPIKVTLSHSHQDGLPQYKALYGCDVVCGHPQNSMQLNTSLIQEALPGFDQGLAEVHQKIADTQLKRLIEPDVITRVKEQLLLSDARVTRDEIAAHLAMSGRSLQRKLQEQGSSFQKLHDEYRHQQSLMLLANKELSLVDISLRLGFSESSTFYRAFKRWQSVTPGEYRQQLNDDFI